MGWRAFGAIFLLVTSCDCGGGSGLTRLRPELVAYDPSIEGHPEIESFDFGSVPFGSISRRPLGIRNIGGDRLTISSAAIDTPFSHDLTGEWIVEAGSERELTVAFEPRIDGEVTGELGLAHDGVNGPVARIALMGRGVEPKVDLSSEMLDFGAVTVDQRRELEVVLTNQTQFAQPFRVVPPVQDASIFGANPRDGEIPASGSFTLRAWFQPVEEGPAMNAFGISWCDGCEKQVSVRGEGIKPAFLLDPPSLDFGTNDQGVATTQRFVVRNIGSVPLAVHSIAPDRNTSGEFSVRIGALPMSLSPGEELGVSVDYTGSDFGDDGGNIEVATDAWNDPSTAINETIGLVALSATTRGPDINPFPSAVSFGTVAVGASRTRILSLQNVGNAPLAINSIALETSTPEIAMDSPPPLPASLDPGLSIDLRLRYTAADEGMDSASVLVASNDGDEPSLSIPITGLGGTPGTCWIEIVPTPVTFGLVERGRTARLPVELRNNGTPCTVSNIRLNGAPEFTIAAGGSGMINIAPGGLHAIEIEYAPADYGIHSTLLEFDSNDPSQMMAQVPITGASDQSSLLVIPSELDFGIVPVGCRSSDRTVTAYNIGASPVQLNNVFLDPATTPELELLPFVTPQTILAGNSLAIDLRYRPISAGADNGVLFIAHSANLNPIVVPLTGEGQNTATVIDNFQQAASARADILFVVDNSGSMDEEQAFLGTNLGAFLSFAQMAGIDYQIAITTTDVEPGGEQGRFVGTPKILTPSTPNVSDVFNTIVTGLGTDGSGDEMGLEASYLALSDPLINTWNAGFLRTDAALAVIYVSDEIDQSPNLPSFYESFLLNLKPVGLFSASSIVGTTDPECVGPSGAAEYAPNYISVANNTGGIVAEICAADWGQSLTAIGLNSFGLRRQFTLSSTPDPSTIAVEVGGWIVPANDWTYDPASNSVVFDAGAEPAEGSAIEITYDAACLP